MGLITKGWLKMLDKIIERYGILSLLGFFLSVFYFDTRGYGESLDEINKNIAVMARHFVSLDEDISELKEDNRRQDSIAREHGEEIKKLGKGLAVVEARLEITGGR